MSARVSTEALKDIRMWSPGHEAGGPGCSGTECKCCMARDLLDAREEIERLKLNAYPHMCRNEHVQIGHSDSEHERCPLCRSQDDLTAARALLGASAEDGGTA